MWHAMFDLQVPLLEKVLRTVLVYAAIVLVLRLAGKRGLANLNTLDLTVLLLLSNVVQNAIIGSDNTVVGAVVGAATLVAVNAALHHAITRSDGLAHVVEGRATPVIENGRLVDANLRRMAIRPEELDHLVRMQNGDDVSEVADGRLQPSGQLVLTLKHGEQSATRADIAALHRQLADIKAVLATLAVAPGQP